jgi:hypothetical protein
VAINDYANFDDWRGSQGSFYYANNPQDMKLGPGQRKPRNYNQFSAKFGEIYLEFFTSKQLLEMRVSSPKTKVKIIL